MTICQIIEKTVQEMTVSPFSTLFVASIEDSLRDIDGCGMYIENKKSLNVKFPLFRELLKFC